MRLRQLYFPLGVLVAYWLWLIHQLGAQWSAYEQYHYGWAVPFLGAYLLWQRLQNPSGRLDRSPVAQASVPASSSEDSAAVADSPAKSSDSSVSGFQPSTTPTVGRPSAPSRFIFPLFLLAFCALLYAPTRLLHEANPIWRLTSLLWSLEVIGLTLCLLSVMHRSGAMRASLSPFRISDCRFQISDLLFPTGFFLVAVPWPSGLESVLTRYFMQLNTGLTVELMGLLGIPAAQHGNVIEVSKGVVGVNEACSGIRSFQATLMISLFLGELYRLSAVRRIVLCVWGFVLAFGFNVLRTCILTWVAARDGTEAIAKWHDPAGVTILLGCFCGLWLLGFALRQKPKLRSQNAEIQIAGTDTAHRASPGLLRSLTFALAVWFVLVEVGVESWYQAHERSAANARNWSIHWPTGDPAYGAIQIPSEIRSQFKYDAGVEGQWRNADGAQWQIYYFRWEPARALWRRVEVQLAKTHGPEKCLPTAGIKLERDLGVKEVTTNGLKILFQQYVFSAAGRPVHVFYGIYEDATGSTVLANRRMNTASRVAAALAGSRNNGQRFLEVAVHGYDNPDDARAALARELAALIKLEN